MRRFSSCQTKIVKNEAKLSIFKTLTLSLYGHENLMMIERVPLHVLASKMRFFQKIEGVASLTRCTSLKIQKSLELLFLQIKRYQLRWFGHVSRIYQKKLPNKLYLPKQMGKKQLDYPELLWMNQYYGTSPKRNDGSDGKP